MHPKLILINRQLVKFFKRKNKKSFERKNSQKKNASKNTFEIESYWGFSRMVLSQFKKQYRFFLKIIIVAGIAIFLTVGFLPQATYNNFRQLAEIETKKSEDLSKKLQSTGIILISVITSGGLGGEKSESQNLALTLIFIFVWLTIVYYFRKHLAGHEVTFSDALYDGGAPIVGIFLLLGVMILQLIPLAIISIIYSILITSIYFQTGLALMILQIIMFFAFAITLFAIVPTFFALGIITLPGARPMQSIDFSKQLLAGRRLKIILRLCFVVLQIILAWVLIFGPLIMLESNVISKFEFFKNVPLITIFSFLMTIISIIWFFTYCYFLYRRVIENEPKRR